MEIVYVINIIFFLWISIYKIRFLSKSLRLPSLNPFMIIFLANIPVIIVRNIVAPAFIVESGLFNKYYQYSLYITNLSLLFNLVLTAFVLWICRGSRFVNHRLPNIALFPISSEGYNNTTRFFLIAAIICFVVLASHSFGVINWLLDPRTGYQAHREGAGQFYDFATTCLSTAFVFHSLKVFDKPVRFLAVSAFYCFLSYFLGSKGFILQFFIYAIILYWFKRARYFNRIFFTSITVAFGLLLLNYSTVVETLDYQSIVEYFDHYKNSTMYFEAYFNGEIDLFHGELWLTNFWGMIPRGFYPDKPYVYGVLHLNEHFFPGATELGHTPAFGGPIGPYADFGVMGVVMDALIDPKTIVTTVFAFVLYRTPRIELIRSNSTLLLMFYTQYAPVIVPFFLFPMNLFIILIIVVWICFLFRLRVFPRRENFSGGRNIQLT